MNVDFRALCAELLAAIQLYTGLNPAASEMSSVEITEKLMDAMATTAAALATPPPEPPTGQIIFNAPPPEEVIRLDKEGFHYKGQFIADAGEAHFLMLAFLKQHAKDEPEPPTDDELQALWHELFSYDDSVSLGDVEVIARAVLERWGK